MLVLVSVISICTFLAKSVKIWKIGRNTSTNCKPRRTSHQTANNSELVDKVQMLENCVTKMQEGSLSAEGFFSVLRQLIATKSYEQ